MAANGRVSKPLSQVVYVRLSAPLKTWLNTRAAQEALATSTYARLLIEKAAKVELLQGDEDEP
jgi:hypothetical protein